VLDREGAFQQVGQEGRVLHVMRVEAAGVEHPHRLAYVDPLLVDLVGEREPVLDPPEPQNQGQQQDAAEDQHPGLKARFIETVAQGRQVPCSQSGRQAGED